MRCFKYTTPLIFIFASFSFSAFSQDHHYWSHQFGSRSALMGGAVVGGVRDTSAGFYNPAALGFVNQPSLSVSANAYQLERLSIDNGAGTGIPLDSNKINVVPLLASGTLFFERFPSHAFGYSLLTKNKTSINMYGRENKTIDIISDKHKGDKIYFAGKEQFIGQLIANSEVTELWGGLSWAYKVRPKISVGSTLFFALRNQSQNRTVTARAKNAKTIASADELDYVDFWNIRTLLKLGIAADFDRFKWGLTVMTPSLNLFGQGTVAGEKSVNNFYDPQQEDFVGTLISNRQENLDTTYKTPFSLAIGLEYAITQKTNLAATVEWFGKQSSYEVITPGSHSFLRNIIIDEIIEFDGNAEEKQALIQVKDAAESVINFGMALEHSFTDKTKGYLSFFVDHETNHNLEENSLGMTNWDIYNFTVGTTFRRKRSELAVGLTYSFGRRQDNFIQFANFAKVREDNLFGNKEITTANYDSISVIVGYTYFFDRQ